MTIFVVLRRSISRNTVNRTTIHHNNNNISSGRKWIPQPKTNRYHTNIQLRCKQQQQQQQQYLHSPYSALFSTYFDHNNQTTNTTTKNVSCRFSSSITSTNENNHNNNNNDNDHATTSTATTTTITTKIAIVGSGPSGCYTAKYLQSALKSSNNSKGNNNDITADDHHNKTLFHGVNYNYQMDILERLPTAYGLVRNGVAPDHPEVKNVQNDFDQLFLHANNNNNNNDDENDKSNNEPSNNSNNNNNNPKIILDEETNEITIQFSNKDNTNNNNNNSIQFYGNVHVGKDVSLQELRELYDIVVLAYGCESDQPIPFLSSSSSSEEEEQQKKTYKNVLSAREFVNWYNGHVDYQWVGTIVQQALSSSSSSLWNDNTTTTKTTTAAATTTTTATSNTNTSKNIVIIGHGNVALDCARILAKDRTELDPTDIATPALNVIRPFNNNNDNDDKEQQEHHQHENSTASVPRNIYILGRRGHVQAAFTIKEIRELTKLPNANFIVQPNELMAGKSTKASQEELKSSRPKSRIDKLLTEHATNNTNNTSSSNTNVYLRFLINPIRFDSNNDDDDDNNIVSRVICERTKLVGETNHQRAQGTGEEEILNVDLVLVSIGYKGMAIPGTEPWYDPQKGILLNTHGLVDPPSVLVKPTLNNDDNTTTTTSLGGLYVSGWLKRGPSGIIGTNIADAKDTVAMIMKQFEQEQTIARTVNDNDHDKQQQQQHLSKNKTKGGGDALKQLLNERGVRYVDWKAYKKIDLAEQKEERKRHPDQPREKFTTLEELLQAGEIAETGEETNM